MKFYLLLFTCFLLSLVIGQSELDTSSNVNSSKSRIYILDNLREPGSSRLIKMDKGQVNCLMIKNGKVIIAGTIRGNAFLQSGKIDGHKMEGDTEVFYSRGKHNTPRSMYSYEISFFENDVGKIHFYNKLSSFDYVFNAHIASEEEVKFIKDRGYAMGKSGLYKLKY